MVSQKLDVKVIFCLIKDILECGRMSNNRPSKSRTDVIYHRAETTPILNIVNILYEENSAKISK